MRILLLGGTGAMGCPLKSILAERGDDVYITSRSAHEDEGNIHYLLGDAHNENFMSDVLKDRYDAIVDFMIYRSGEFAEKANRLLSTTDHYIFTSSSRVYANLDKPITEESPRLLDVCKDEQYLKTDEYALAKAREENVLLRNRQKKWTIIRPYITYNVERLQLGAMEKDVWLRRAMGGKSIPFPEDVAVCQTTMTYGGDVAASIAALIGNASAFGEAFNLTGVEYMTWREISEIYSKTLIRITGVEPTFYSPQNSKKLCEAMGNEYQIKYDRLYNRIFDNSKLMKACNYKLMFTPIEEGVSYCLEEFLKSPKYGNILNPRFEAYLNKKLQENLQMKNFPDGIARLKYLGWYFAPKAMKNIKRICKY